MLSAHETSPLFVVPLAVSCALQAGLGKTALMPDRVIGLAPHAAVHDARMLKGDLAAVFQLMLPPTVVKLARGPDSPVYLRAHIRKEYIELV